MSGSVGTVQFLRLRVIIIFYRQKEEAMRRRCEQLRGSFEKPLWKRGPIRQCGG